MSEFLRHVKMQINTGVVILVYLTCTMGKKQYNGGSKWQNKRERKQRNAKEHLGQGESLFATLMKLLLDFGRNEAMKKILTAFAFIYGYFWQIPVSVFLFLGRKKELLLR